MKKSITLIELILVILLIAVVATFFIPQKTNSKFEESVNRLELYLKYLRYQALVDNKYDDEDSLWYKKRWTLKFFRCRQSVGGIYYSIYSDRNKSGHPSVEDSMKDPLTNKNIHSSNYCKENSINSKYVLLSKNGISNIHLSCNETNSLGQISFASNGKVYSRLSNYENEENEYEIEETCILKFYGSNNEEKEIKIESITGFIK